jgi:hypothetical protein
MPELHTSQQHQLLCWSQEGTLQAAADGHDTVPNTHEWPAIAL